MSSVKMRAGSGHSFQFHNQWFKLYYEEERIIEIPGDMEDNADVLEEERTKLWDTVNNQVDEQMRDIVSMDSKQEVE